MTNRVKSLLFFVYSLFRRDARPKIVFYHDIGLEWTSMGTPREMFWAHMRFLRKDDEVFFDDGFRGVWAEREEFKRRGIRPKLSIAPRLVGTNGYLSWDELRILKDEFGFGVVCHGWSHQTMAGPMVEESPIEERTEDWYERELVLSKQKISDELGVLVDELCFPVGYYSQDVIARCKRAGYKRVYVSYPGVKGADYLQPRCIAQDLNVVGFKAILNGGMDIFCNRYRRAHEIG